MAISPYSTPAQQQTIKLQDYTPVEMMGRVIDKFDARQAEGLAAMDKLDALKYDLSQRVLTQQQPLVDQALKDVNSRIEALSKSGDYIDALPEVRRMASRITQTMGRFNQNYDAVAARKKEISELLAKDPNALANGDMDYFLGDSLKALENDPNAQFSAPMLTGRVDRGKLLTDFISKMKPEEVVRTRAQDGKWIETTVSNLSQEQKLQAAMEMMAANPAIVGEMERDFQWQKGKLGEDAAEKYLWEKWGEMEEAKVSILANEDLTPAERDAYAASITASQEDLAAGGDLDASYRRGWMSDELRRSAEPFSQLGERGSFKEKWSADPYAVIRARSASDEARAIRAEQREAAATNQGASDAFTFTGSTAPAIREVPHGVTIASAISAGEGVVANLETQLKSNQLGAITRGNLLDQLDDARMTLSMLNERKSKYMTQAGVSPEQWAKLQESKPSAPAGMTAEQYEKAVEYAKDGRRFLQSGQPAAAPAGVRIITPDTMDNAWWKSLTDVQKQWYSKAGGLADWYGQLSQAERDIDKKVETMRKADDEANAGMTVGWIVPEKEREQSIARSWANTKGTMRYFRGDPEDGKEITDTNELASLRIKAVDSISNRPVGLPGNETGSGFRMAGVSEDDEAITMIITDTEAMRKRLGETYSGSAGITRTAAGWRLHALRNGDTFEPSIRGVNPLGEGTRIQKNEEHYVLILPNGGRVELTENEAIGRLQAGQDSIMAPLQTTEGTPLPYIVPPPGQPRTGR